MQAKCPAAAEPSARRGALIEQLENRRARAYNAESMWGVAAALIAALLVIAGVTGLRVSRKRGTDAAGVGKLSDAWLAEKRRSAD